MTGEQRAAEDLEETPDTGDDGQAAAAQASEGGDAPSGSAHEEDAPAPSVEEDDELARARAALAERTGDLQRLQAEYLNYKRRVDRDRELVRQNATFTVLTPILDVLDAIDRAREHGELEGGFKAVAEQLERAVAGMGLTRFGDPGDAFDPNLHEALSHVGTDPEVSVMTCKHIAKSGYQMGERVVRAAQVLVVDPPEPADRSQPDGPVQAAQDEPAEPPDEAGAD